MALHPSVVRRSLPCLLVCTLLASLCGACGTAGPLAPDSALVRQSAQVISLEEALAQLEELAQPAGLSDADFERQKDALEQVLIAQGQSRFVSLAPSSPLSAVDDLGVISQGAGPLTYDWTYKNQGDYDFNSEVNIADLTPIGQHFRKTPSAPDWPVAQAADGDINNEVNIADITPIGAGFQRKVDAYRLQESLDGNPTGTWLDVATIPFAQSTLVSAEGRRTFSAEFTPQQGGRFYRVIPEHAGAFGIPSNIVQAQVSGIPGRPENLTATQGTLFNSVSLDWDALAGCDNYEVGRRVNIADEFTTIATIDAAETEYADNDVVSGTRYQYIVKGTAGELSSTNSVIAEGWPLETPLTPENLLATDGESAAFIALSWDSVPFADEYLIFRSSTAGSGHTQIASSPTNSFQDETATFDSKFYYYVIASNQAGSSAQSNEDEGWLLGALPILTAVSPLEVLRGLSTEFSATNEGAVATSWEWDFGGAGEPASSTDENPTLMPNQLGSFSCTVTATSSAGSDSFDFELLVSDSQWVNSYGVLGDDSSNSIGVDGTGNVYVVGRLGTAPVFLKYGPDGGLIWQKRFEPAVSELGVSAKVDSDGNVYAFSIPISPNMGMLAAKISPDGALLWHKLYTTATQTTSVKSAIDGSGNALASVTVLASTEDTAMIKVDPAGNLLWQKLYSHGGALGHDLMGNDGFIADSSGNVYLAGDEGRIVKFDSMGNLLWEKEYGGSGHDHPYAMVVDEGGNVYLGGGSDTPGMPYRSYIVKLSSAGALVWQNFYLMPNGPANSPDYSHFRIDGNGNLYALTTDDSNATFGPQLVRYDLDGNVSGHWSLNHSVTKPQLYGFALDSSGYIYLSGMAPDKEVSWQVETGTEGVMPGSVSDSTGTASEGVGFFNATSGSLTDAAGQIDGGGQGDIISIKLNPDSLPQP